MLQICSIKITCTKVINLPVVTLVRSWQQKATFRTLKFSVKTPTKDVLKDKVCFWYCNINISSYVSKLLNTGLRKQDKNAID